LADEFHTNFSQTGIATPLTTFSRLSVMGVPQSGHRLHQ
jgi:hypothetical protein